MNPQLKIGATCFLAFALVINSSSAGEKSSFQLVQRLLHENTRLHVSASPSSPRIRCERIGPGSRSSPTLKWPHYTTRVRPISDFCHTSDTADYRADRDADTSLTAYAMTTLSVALLCAKKILGAEVFAHPLIPPYLSPVVRVPLLPVPGPLSCYITPTDLSEPQPASISERLTPSLSAHRSARPVSKNPRPRVNWMPAPQLLSYRHQFVPSIPTFSHTA